MIMLCHNISSKCITFCDELKSVENIKITRKILRNITIDLEVFGFTDAREYAMVRVSDSV